MRLNKKTYFSFFFLFCFLASFSINSITALKTDFSVQKVVKNHKYSYSQKEDTSSANTEVLFDENENEDEHDFALSIFIAPHIIVYVSGYNVSQKNISVNPLIEKQSTPIYLQVCNFRI